MVAAGGENTRALDAAGSIDLEPFGKKRRSACVIVRFRDGISMIKLLLKSPHCSDVLKQQKLTIETGGAEEGNKPEIKHVHTVFL